MPSLVGSEMCIRDRMVASIMSTKDRVPSVEPSSATIISMVLAVVLENSVRRLSVAGSRPISLCAGITMERSINGPSLDLFTAGTYPKGLS